MSGFENPYSLLPPLVKVLLISNELMFVLGLVYGRSLIINFVLWPLNNTMAPELGISMPHFQPHQLLTCSFLHRGALHLLLNIYALWLAYLYLTIIFFAWSVPPSSSCWPLP